MENLNTNKQSIIDLLKVIESNVNKTEDIVSINNEN